MSKYAIFAKNSWWRGITQDDHVVFYIRDGESNDEVRQQLDPKGEHVMTFVQLMDDDILRRKFGVDVCIFEEV